MTFISAVFNARLLVALAVAAAVTLYQRSQQQQQQQKEKEKEKEQRQAAGARQGGGPDNGLWRLFLVTFVATYVIAFVADSAGAGQGTKVPAGIKVGGGGGGGGAVLLDDVMKHVDMKLPTF